MDGQKAKTVRVGGVTLGRGMPKICVPVMGPTLEEIRAQAARAAQAGADLMELRADSLSPMPSPRQAQAACEAARAGGALPLLFTLRTARDGGAGDADPAAYGALLEQVAKSGCCDAVDCELSVGEAAFARIAAAAHAAGVPVIGSSHAFYVPQDAELPARWLARQAALGADVCKAAVMAGDGVQALELAWRMARAGGETGRPYIAIVMGGEGALTRAACECVGSCLTFASAGEASAPGQMDARALRPALSLIHRAMTGEKAAPDGQIAGKAGQNERK